MILSRLKKADFKPKDDYNVIPTQVYIIIKKACERLCEFLDRAKREIDQNLEGANHEVYLTELGTSLYCSVADQMKKYPVNNGGGLIWTTDITKYHSLISQFNIDALYEQFGCLKELANLFIVKPENLKSVISQGFVARVDLRNIRPYLELRQDWKKLSKIEKDLFKDEVQKDAERRQSVMPNINR